ncbi:MAG TPA: hypothetical protein VFT24_06385 [Vicinamibacterales bacterium]|nr:hypothetical protein [Vicinamibacterales bacterium]
MRILRWLAVIAVALPATAFADDHRADMNGGVSYAKGSHLVGVQGGVAFTLPRLSTDPHRYWSVIAFETSVQSNGDETRHTLMSGVRYTRAALTNHDNHKFFAHAMVGLGQKGETGQFDNDFATAFGGGWEFIWNKQGKPAAEDANGFRVQFDYVIAQGETTNFPRFSFSYVRRFKK